VYANLVGAEHGECSADGQNRLNPWYIAMFDCHIKNVHKQCSAIYGTSKKSPCSLCECDSIDLKECLFENSPEFY
jgi:hypothetical protein